MQIDPRTARRRASRALVPALVALVAGCGSSGATSEQASAETGNAGSAGAAGSGGAAGASGGAEGGTSASGGGGGEVGSGGASGSGGAAPVPCGGACPSGTTCGKANGLEVCRAPSGIPLFSNVFVILMENTSLATLKSAMDGGGAPNLAAMAKSGATGSDYHGVAHPSLPNYVALTSGDTQGIGCDCKAEMGKGSCNLVSCNLVVGSCSCDTPATNLADQLEAAKRTWTAFGEDMATPCNLVDAGSYAVRHVPFLYYDDVQTDQARCTKHVVDLSTFDASALSDFVFIAPNLVHDMHDPFPAGAQNIANGDAWIGPAVQTILDTDAWKKGGLLVVVWDEDDASGGITGTDDPIGVFVFSPYAKSGGYVSAAKADHYSLLATIEDGLGLPRLGKAGMPRAGVADTLSDYFPPE